MVKIRNDLLTDPTEWFVLLLHHDGPDGPGPDRAHILRRQAFYDWPYDNGWARIYDSQATADGVAARLLLKPEIIQDLCSVCHILRYGPLVPRWDPHTRIPRALITPATYQPDYPPP